MFLSWTTADSSVVITFYPSKFNPYSRFYNILILYLS